MKEILKFNDFTTKEGYCRLQVRFEAMDIRNVYDEKREEPLEDINIILCDFDGEDSYEEKSFISDFIISNIPYMVHYYKRKFLQTIKSKSLLTKALREGLAEVYISNLRKTSNSLSEASYLTKEIIDLLEEQIQLIEEFITEYSANPYPEIKRKIQFKWNKTNVIYFFHLLRLNKEINDISNADLGRIIDRVCEYSNNDEYFAINNSSKLLSDFNTISGRSVDKTVEHLREVFKDDFFNI